MITKDGKPVLEFVAVKRKDCDEWAIPGVSYCNKVKQFLFAMCVQYEQMHFEYYIEHILNACIEVQDFATCSHCLTQFAVATCTYISELRNCNFVPCICCQGMVDPGDTVSATLKKEFGEEAMNSLEVSPDEKKKIEEQINQLFSQGEEVILIILLLFTHILYYLTTGHTNKVWTCLLCLCKHIICKHGGLWLGILNY